MEWITTVHVNCVSEERMEEYSNWYNYVHFRDVMGMPGHIAAQRFWRAKYQPKVYDPTYRFWTIYELRSKELSTKGHQAAILSWKMQISTAMDLSNYHHHLFLIYYSRFLQILHGIFTALFLKHQKTCRRALRLNPPAGLLSVPEPDRLLHPTVYPVLSVKRQDTLFSRGFHSNICSRPWARIIRTWSSARE